MSSYGLAETGIFIASVVVTSVGIAGAATTVGLTMTDPLPIPPPPRQTQPDNLPSSPHSQRRQSANYSPPPPVFPDPYDQGTTVEQTVDSMRRYLDKWLPADICLSVKGSPYPLSNDKTDADGRIRAELENFQRRVRFAFVHIADWGKDVNLRNRLRLRLNNIVETNKILRKPRNGPSLQLSQYALDVLAKNMRDALLYKKSRDRMANSDWDFTYAVWNALGYYAIQVSLWNKCP